MTQLWPGNENMKIWAEDCADFEKLMDYIKAVRTMRAEMNVHPAKLVEETRAKLAAAQEKAAKIKESIAALG